MISHHVVKAVRMLETHEQPAYQSGVCSKQLVRRHHVLKSSEPEVM